MIREKIISQLMQHTKEDLSMLPWIIGYAARDTGRAEEGEDEPLSILPISDPIEIKAKTLALVRDLLNTRVVEAGDLADGGRNINPWRIPVDEVIERIDREWSSHGRTPNLDFELVWLGPCKSEDWPHGKR